MQMVQVIVPVLVVVIGACAFRLAWLSRDQRSALLLFGGIGLTSTALLLRALLVRSAWIHWTMAIFAGLGSLAVIWGVLMAQRVSRGINSMLLRDFESGQSFVLSRAARVARVGSLILRHQITERRGDGSFAVTLLAMSSNTEATKNEFVLHKPVNQPGTTIELGGYLVRLEAVVITGKKASMYTATLEVVEADS